MDACLPTRPRRRSGSRPSARTRSTARSGGQLHGPERVDALHLARLERDRQLVQQQLSDFPVAWLRRRLPGVDSRAAHHSARRTRRTFPRASASGWATPADAGRATRSSSRRRTSIRRRTIEDRARRCVWSNATRRSTRRTSTTSSRSTIRRPSPARGPWRGRCAARPAASRFSSTPATRATTPCTTSSPALAL